MATYTSGGDIVDRAWYDAPYRLHKTDFMDKLKALPSDTSCMPYYVTNHEYERVSVTAIARNVYVGIVPKGRPYVVQDGDLNER